MTTKLISFKQGSSLRIVNNKPYYIPTREYIEKRNRLKASIRAIHKKRDYVDLCRSCDKLFERIADHIESKSPAG